MHNKKFLSSKKKQSTGFIELYLDKGSLPWHNISTFVLYLSGGACFGFDGETFDSDHGCEIRRGLYLQWTAE